MSASALSTLPILIIFVVRERNIIAGLTRARSGVNVSTVYALGAVQRSGGDIADTAALFNMDGSWVNLVQTGRLNRLSQVQNALLLHMSQYGFITAA